MLYKLIVSTALLTLVLLTSCGGVYKQTAPQTLAPDSVSLGTDFDIDDSSFKKIKFGIKWDLK